MTVLTAGRNKIRPTYQTIKLSYLKLIIMKTNKKVQKNNVQKSEKETAVKVTALAIIPKPIILLSPQNVPTATEVTETPETATIPTITEEAPQQATFKTPLATATAETDLDITTVHPSADNHRKTFNDASLQELAESIREVGVLQAIAVRPHTAGGYEIIYGERRYRASLLAGAKTIKATIYNNITDDEAEDMSLSENLQREEVRPTEEAKAFKRLLEKGRYDMYSLVSRFGRSEKYIYTRLKLNELYQPIGELLDNETITISVAEEISTYEPNIQKDVYEKHLKENSRDNWAGYTLKLFKKYFEEYYTTDLEQYKFDKTECKACVHNAANYNLFAEHNGCGHCTNRKCLDTKNAAFVAKETEKLLKSDPKLAIARPYYGGMNETALQKLDKKGHEIKELNYTVSAQSFPKAPEAPRQEQFSKPKEYEQAVQTFEQKNEEYARKVEELNRKKEEGRIKTYVKVGQTEPELCYVEINKKETAPVTVETLQERDKRFKQLSVEKIVADTKKVVRENDYPESPFTQYEDGMMYFIMLTKLQRKHYPLCGIKDQPIRLDEKQRMKIVAKLTDAQKTVIKRDFINYFLCEDAYGDNSASKLLRDFANMHFPDQYGLAKATHEEEYQKRHERLDERIKEMKKAEKAAAKKDEKQNVSPALPNDDKAA
jgi:ParB family chromosome partitioning protein